MNRIHTALFPALLFGILVIVFFTSLAGVDESVQASNEQVQTNPTQAAPATSSDEKTSPSNSQRQPDSSSTDCSLSKKFTAAIRQWCSLITRYAAQYQVNPSLIAAVMLQESGGNPKAYSKSGAVGLMQVMPRDGLAAQFQCNGRPCFSSRPTMTELFDPEYNISYGVRMLAGLIQRTGNPRDALKSYGPMDVGYYYADKVLKIFEVYQ
jgi:soluble lytic murein transglycosylase-like protein